MPLSYGFFDGEYTNNAFDRLYTSGQMSEMFNGVITDGIYLNWEAGLLTVTKTPGSSMGLTVSPGKAWFDGTWTINSSNLYLTVDTGEEDRTVAVVLEVNRTNGVRENRIIVIDAESVDDLERDGIGGNINQYALAYVTVEGGESAVIHDYDIKNVAGTDETPYFAWILQDLSVSDVVKKWTDILGRTTIEFVTWFALMVRIFGDDDTHPMDDGAYSVLYDIIVETSKLPYIDRILPRVNEFEYTITADGRRTYTILTDFVYIANVRVNGNHYPYSKDGNTITFIDAPVSGAQIVCRLVPILDLYDLYFEEPEEQGG